MRFLQTSDWQLGMTRWFLEGEAQARFADARLEAVRELGRVAARAGCDLVVVAGDVFEHSQVSTQTVRRALEALREVTVPVLLLPGNHDPVDASSVYRSPAFVQACPPHVTVLERPGLHEIAPGVEIVAAPWASKHPLSDLCADALRGLDPPAEGVVRVLVGHGQLDVLSPDSRSASLLSLDALDAAVESGLVHWVALGDRHSALGLGRTGRVHYSGAPEVTAFREECPGDVLVVTLEPGGEPEVERHRVGSWAFTEIELDVGDDDLDELAARLDELPAKDRHAVRHILRGHLSLGGRARLDALLAERADLFASLHPHETATHLTVSPQPEDIERLQVSGFVRSAVDELVERSHAGAGDAAAATGALALLTHLLGQQGDAPGQSRAVGGAA